MEVFYIVECGDDQMIPWCILNHGGEREPVPFLATARQDPGYLERIREASLREMHSEGLSMLS